jgi:hypothetical protein
LPPDANLVAIDCILVVGPQVEQQKMNFSNHIFKKVVCSLWSTAPILACSEMYPFQPFTRLVASRCEVLMTVSKGWSDSEMSRPGSIKISSSVGVIGSLLNRKALSASDRNSRQLCANFHVSPCWQERKLCIAQFLLSPRFPCWN